MKTKRGVFSVAALLFLATTVHAAHRDLSSPSPTAFTGNPPGFSPAVAGAGFESGEGFVLGPIEPQLGWSATGTNSFWAYVGTENPFTGIRQLRLLFNSEQAQGAQQLVFSPSTSAAPNTPSTTYIRVNISNDGGADYEVVGQAPSEALLTWRVKFSYSNQFGGPGHFYVVDNILNTLQYVDTGLIWPEATYMELRVDFDPVAGRILYYIDGAHLYTGNLLGATRMEQLVLRTDNFQLLQGETADFDGWSVQALGDPSVGIQPASWSGVKALYH